jgi:hypothetical protein
MRVRIAALACVALAGACTGAGSPPETGTPGGEAVARRGEATPSPERGVVAASQPLPEGLGIGRLATHDEIALWDIDVRPDGMGLPPGSGTHAQGRALFSELCASCHGVRGEGTDLAGRLVSDDAASGFRQRVTGHFWPYATTLYDYIQRSMPQTSPGSLAPDEVYSLVAWLLAENGVIGTADVMDAATLPAVEMPAQSRFVPDDRVRGAEIR